MNRRGLLGSGAAALAAFFLPAGRLFGMTRTLAADGLTTIGDLRIRAVRDIPDGEIHCSFATRRALIRAADDRARTPMPRVETHCFADFELVGPFLPGDEGGWSPNRALFRLTTKPGLELPHDRHERTALALRLLPEVREFCLKTFRDDGHAYELAEWIDEDGQVFVRSGLREPSQFEAWLRVPRWNVSGPYLR